MPLPRAPSWSATKVAWKTSLLRVSPVDVVISNGVMNLSFQKRRVLEEIFRILKPGGSISITDIVSGKQLSQSIVNDPKLWAS